MGPCDVVRVPRVKEEETPPVSVSNIVCEVSQPIFMCICFGASRMCGMFYPCEVTYFCVTFYFWIIFGEFFPAFVQAQNRNKCQTSEQQRPVMVMIVASKTHFFLGCVYTFCFYDDNRLIIRLT